MEDVICRLWLAKTGWFTERHMEKVIRVFGSETALFKAGTEVIQRSGIFTERQAEMLSGSRDPDVLRRSYEIMLSKGIRCVRYEDEDYPDRLKTIYDPPIALFVKGRLPESREPLISIIGSRKCSSYGIRMAAFFSGGIACAGVGIVSGMARGIDSLAHQGALAVHTPTYAVLGCGTDICYPPENRKLYEEIGRQGGLISEYVPGTAPASRNFPRRNRIISGMSAGLLVIQSARRSGTQITVDQALEQGRDVFAVPGYLDDPLSEGCNLLIRQGAKMVTRPEDVLEELGGKILWKKADIFNLDRDQYSVYMKTGLIPRSFGDIVSLTGMEPAKAAYALAQLEQKGMIRNKGNLFSLLI